MSLRIVIFGDSISAYRDDLHIASMQLSERLKSRGVDFNFLNSAVKGNTSEMGRERFRKDVLDHCPDLVIIAFGTNDSAVDIYLDKTVPRVSLERYSENIRYFISELEKRQAKVIFYSSPPIYLTENLKSKYRFQLDRYMDAQRKIVLASPCYYLDINQIFMDKAGGYGERLLEYMPDGMHPNEAGQKIIADSIWALWEEHPEILTARKA